MAVYLGIGGLLLVVALLLAIVTRPAAFHIERSAIVDAPRDVVFPLINNLHNWVQWSPFEKLDPDMKKTFDGPPEGPGASYAWSGNSKAGEGRMTIVESKPGELVSMRLEFTR